MTQRNVMYIKFKKICFCLKLHKECYFMPLNILGRYFYGSITFRMCTYNDLCDHFLMLLTVIVHSFLLLCMTMWWTSLCIHYCALFIILGQDRCPKVEILDFKVNNDFKVFLHATKLLFRKYDPFNTCECVQLTAPSNREHQILDIFSCDRWEHSSVFGSFC